MRLEPLHGLLVIGHRISYHRPEVSRMIELNQVCQFMNNHIVNDLRRRKKQSRRKPNEAAAAATAPIGLVVAQLHATDFFLKKAIIPVIHTSFDFGQEVLSDHATEELLN